MIDQGEKEIEFRRDTIKNREKLAQQTHFTAYRGPCFSKNKVPNMDVQILDTFLLPDTFSHTLTYPNKYTITLKGPLIAIVLGQVLRRGGPSTYVRWSPHIKNKIFY